MCGIFGYVNFLVDKSRGEIIDNLIEGLQRLEYRVMIQQVLLLMGN